MVCLRCATNMIKVISLPCKMNIDKSKKPETGSGSGACSSKAEKISSFWMVATTWTLYTWKHIRHQASAITIIIVFVRNIDMPVAMHHIFRSFISISSFPSSCSHDFIFMSSSQFFPTEHEEINVFVWIFAGILSSKTSRESNLYIAESDRNDGKQPNGKKALK